MKCFLTLALLLAGCAQAEPRPYYALDGDTISVGTGPHIRLLYIDAPELPGHCRPSRQCVAGDPYAARMVLQHLLQRGDMICRDKGRDVYLRRLADCYIIPNRAEDGNYRNINLSQAMLDSGLVSLYKRSSK